VNEAALLERRYRLIGRHSPLFYERPLHLVRGEGVWVWDADGKRYLDAYNNVPHVGHCHPHVVQAIARQAATLNVHTRYLHESILDYVERLTETFDPSLSMAMLACSEARPTNSRSAWRAIRPARRASSSPTSRTTGTPKPWRKPGPLSCPKRRPRAAYVLSPHPIPTAGAMV
jgi:acetylornithine/succinyldiaminopimelate/putrescine aminotransferase